MTKKMAIILAILGLFTVIQADSIFSYKGMPDNFSGRDVVGQGMGETGIGNALRQNLSLFNPALSTNQQYTTFSTSFSFGKMKTKGSSATYNSDQGFLPNFSMTVPYQQHRFGINCSVVGNGIFNTQSAGTDPSISGNYTEIQKTDNSLYHADLFYANKNKILDFGIGLNLNFGHRVNYWKIDFENTDYLDAKYEIDETFKKPSLTVGVVKNMNDKYSFGGVLALPVKLTGDRTFKTVSINENIANSSYELPWRLAFGGAMVLNPFFNMSMDVDLEDWKSVDTYEDPTFSWKLGYGVEYSGQGEGYGFIKRIPLRAGITYRLLPFQYNSNNLYEAAGTFGFSLPIKSKDTGLDFAFKYFQRGNQSDNLFHESGFLFTIGTRGFDIFKKPLDRKGDRQIPVPDNNGL